MILRLRFFILLLIIPSTSIVLLGQSVSIKKYRIDFIDKANSPYSIDNPSAYLSVRSINRRKKQNIKINSSDFPVNPDYLEGLRSFTIEIINTSKWLNSATVLADECSLPQLERLPFIKKITYVGKSSGRQLLFRRSGKNRNDEPPIEKTDNHYGFAEHQISQINLQALHEEGYRGEGMLIAVLDGGFSNTDIMPFFDKMRNERRLLPAYDFVEKDDYVFDTSVHGSQVLSVMAADLPNVMVGTAPDAHFLCLKTEDNTGEYPAEECNWVAALEYADSVGVDVINSSLGYTTFSDASMNYNYSNMDGKTSIACIAADYAFAKGIIVVNSVGNDGNTKWKYLNAPADAKNILAVGATDQAGYAAKFSSFGPTADGRIKPEVCAPGQDIAVASVYSTRVNATQGTSFSAPIIAGAIASLWQAVPYRTNTEIIEAIKLSAHRAHAPDNRLGYGIPDFLKALELLR